METRLASPVSPPRLLESIVVPPDTRLLSHTNLKFCSLKFLASTAFSEADPPDVDRSGVKTLKNASENLCGLESVQ